MKSFYILSKMDVAFFFFQDQGPGGYSRDFAGSNLLDGLVDVHC